MEETKISEHYPVTAHPEKDISEHHPENNIPIGVIVSGGYNDGDMASTEVYIPTPGSGYTCSLQNMPSPRAGHTLDQLGDGTVLACGGYPTLKTCDKFDGTSWSQHSTLLYRRGYHTSLPGQHE